MVDLVIVGGGPAGVTAAIYAARKKIDFIMITQDIGGQTAWSADVENYTGYQFITGLELVKKFEEHLKLFNVQLKNNERVERIEKIPAGGFAVLTLKERYEGRAVLVASGRRPRLLGVPGEEAFKNKGVTYCATCDGPIFAGKDVAVIGGGNSALDAVLQLVRIAGKIYVVNVAPELTGDAVMIQKAQGSPRVEILNSTSVVEIYGRQFVEGVRVERAGQKRDLAVSGVFIEIGSVPNSDIVDFVAKEPNGEIIVDQLNRTNSSGLFAAGDVTNVPEKQIVVAAGEGAKAVLGIWRYLTTQVLKKGF